MNVDYWQGLLSNYRHNEYVSILNDDSLLTPVKYYFSKDNSKELLSISNGSSKRLSVLLTSLVACAQAKMLNKEQVMLLTSNFSDEPTESEFLCLPFNLDDENKIQDVILNTSNSIRSANSFKSEFFDYIFDSEIKIPVAVILKNCQKVTEEFFKHSLTQLCFESDEEYISCDMTSVHGIDYVTTLLNLVTHWVSQIRTQCTISQLKTLEPFYLAENILTENISEDLNIEKDSTIISRLAEQVKCQPSKTAIVDEFAQLSYEDLDKLSDVYASQLIKLGIKRGDTVGVHMPRSCLAVVAIFAVLKAGGRYCPFDIAWPVARKEYVSTVASIKIVLTSTKTRFELKQYEELVLDNLQPNTTHAGNRADFPNLNGQDSAYVIFTSGSTGKPKGVEIPHSAVTNLVSGLYERVYKHYPHELNVSMISALSFDASVQQMYPALLLGHTLHIVPEETRKDGMRICNFWKDRKIHIADCTPTHLRMICSQLKEHQLACEVKHLMVGGEKLDQQNWQNFAQCWEVAPNASNAYGPTECCVQSASFEFSYLNQIRTKTIPIGLPMPGEEIVLIDKFMQVLPKGAIGEIAISGHGLAKGYINDDELTKKAFIDIDGKRYYRTGDLARYIGNEGLMYLGRIDSQVKINGYRIELGEVEKVIQRLILSKSENTLDKLVVDIHVVANTKNPDNQFLIAYICSECHIDCEAVREKAKAHLPGYMVPAYIIPVDAFPQNSSGKIDVSQLPDPQFDVVKSQRQACTNDIEKAILTIWAELLNTREENISILDNFFDLGGSSFKLAQLSFKLSEKFEQQIDVVDLFQYTTIQSQARFINGSWPLLTGDEIDEDSTEQFDKTLDLIGL